MYIIAVQYSHNKPIVCLFLNLQDDNRRCFQEELSENNLKAVELEGEVANELIIVWAVQLAGVEDGLMLVVFNCSVPASPIGTIYRVETLERDKT